MDANVTMVSSTDATVFHSYDAGFIVLSYFVSCVGCWTALELLHRKTSTRGLYNWYLLLGAAIAMGAVAIWSMHFIGNRAITMDAGQPDLQIGYNPGFTAGSFFLPICVVGIAFYLFTISEQVTSTGTIAGGCLTGFAICGMHYMGQGGISNYEAVYDWKFVLGSAIVAVVAATLSLGVFFYFRSAWTNTWWKRMACALLLAVAVSGMHWIATVGTSYQLRSSSGIIQDGMSRQTTVVVVLCLAIGCCITLFVFAAIGQASRHRYSNRAQQVVLACAIWDEEGRLLVTPEGLLPCRKITDTYMQRSFDDIFSVEHPVFCWIYRVSRYWQGVEDLIPNMRNHVRTTSFGKDSRPGTASITKDSSDGIEDYSQIFKELFCVAAHDLASMLQEPLENLGVLFDEIVSTGTVKITPHGQLMPRSSSAPENGDIERATRVMTFGRGQLLFVVRKVNKLQSAHLQASGFRFAPTHHVIDLLARSMQITVEELRPRLFKMREYPVTPLMLAPGVHLALFVLRPLFQRGFDILVRKHEKSLLPTVTLPFGSLEMWQIDFIRRFDNWEPGTCLTWLSKESQSATATDRERLFFSQLYNGISAMSRMAPTDLSLNARLTARPLRAPAYDIATGTYSQAQIIAFRFITDVHQSQLPNYLEFTPTRFFLCQQHLLPNSPDHALFARRIHREFASIIDRSDATTPTKSSTSISKGVRNILRRAPSSPRLSTLGSSPGRQEFRKSIIRGDNSSSSEKGLFDEAGSGTFGGIHVHNEIVVESTQAHNGNRTPDVEMGILGVFSEASRAPVERETFIDELMALTLGEKRYQKL